MTKYFSTNHDGRPLRFGYGVTIIDREKEKNASKWTGLNRKTSKIVFSKH